MSNLAHVSEKPLIHPVPPAGQEQQVQAILEGIEQHIGFIPDGLRLYSFSPPLLESFVGNISYFNGGSNLSPSLMAMIRYLVSYQADCTYCIDLNEGFLLNFGHKLDDVRAARSNPDDAPLGEDEKVLLKLALKSVDNPGGINSEDLQQARNAGFSDRDVFDVVVQAANNRAFNNVLAAFKLEHQGAFA